MNKASKSKLLYLLAKYSFCIFSLICDIINVGSSFCFHFNFIDFIVNKKQSMTKSVPESKKQSHSQPIQNF